MNRILRKDPIVEARCEFQFDSPDWDWTVPGLLWNQFREEFPLKQQFEFVPSDVPEDTKEVFGVSQLNFWRQDKTEAIHTSPNELAIVQRAPYAGWPIFKDRIEEVLAKYRKIIPNSSLKRTSLSYFNLLPLPSKEFQVQDYLNIYPTFPVTGRAYFGTWIHQAEILKPDAKVLLLVKAGFVPQSDEGSERMMMLDIVANESLEYVFDGNEMDWLETSHNEIETLFFDCLKPKYLELLELEELKDENQTS